MADGTWVSRDEATEQARVAGDRKSDLGGGEKDLAPIVPITPETHLILGLT
jgi:hypothetical protein